MLPATTCKKQKESGPEAGWDDKSIETITQNEVIRQVSVWRETIGNIKSIKRKSKCVRYCVTERRSARKCCHIHNTTVMHVNTKLPTMEMLWTCSVLLSASRTSMLSCHILSEPFCVSPYQLFRHHSLLLTQSRMSPHVIYTHTYYAALQWICHKAHVHF